MSMEQTNLNNIELEDKLDLNEVTLNKRILKRRIIYNGSLVDLNKDIWIFKHIDRLEDGIKEIKFDFTNISKKFRDYVKIVIFKKFIYQQCKYNGVKLKYLNYICLFLSFIESKKIYSPALITVSIIEEYLLTFKKTLKENTKRGYKVAIIALIKEFENSGIKLNYKDIYKILGHVDSKLVQLDRENGKTNRIPTVFFETMLNIALNEIRDNTVDEDYRIQSAVIILLSQIGLRIGELRIIEVNKKETIYIKNAHTYKSILHFKTYKTVKSKEFKWTKSFLTEEAEEAYDFLCKLAEQYGNNKFMFKNKNGEIYSKGKFRGMIFRFCARNHKRLNSVNLSDTRLKELVLGNAYKSPNYYMPQSYSLNLKPSDTISFPLPHQFRVTVASILYEKGIHLEWIREHMNHLSSDMTAHYIREEKMKQEHALKVAEYVKDELKVNKQFNELDTKKRMLLFKKIDRFMNLNKINIALDLKEIINQVGNKKPIREKELGYCIKSNFGVACPKNTEIDIPDLDENTLPSCEFINISYNRFKKIQEVIRFNKKNGFKVEAQRELKRLNKLIHNFLIPELKELKEEIIRLGKEVVHVYGHLEEFISNIDKIESEINKCLKMK